MIASSIATAGTILGDANGELIAAAMGKRKLSIAIIGAGIGGLTTASALLRFGIEVQIYEQASRFARIGAGIQQTPNAIRVLRGVGLEERLRRIAFRPLTSLSREWDTGALTNEYPLGDEIEQRFGAPHLLLHRGDLHDILAVAVWPKALRRLWRMRPFCRDVLIK